MVQWVPAFLRERVKTILSVGQRRRGALRERIGRLQFEFLVGRGLRPEHSLLDVGCGNLRGGVHFIRYLEPGHYYGIDKNPERLDQGRREVKRLGLADKHPRLVQIEDFNFQALNHTFDYALAQSLFTHLPLNSILRCLVMIETVLRPGGEFYATFFENPHGKSHLAPIPHPRVDGPDFLTYPDRDPYHYDIQTFHWICEGTGLEVESIGEWNHPRDQRLLCFRRR